ncbi:collagen binding domain-containing protein, partial [Bacillus pumilus]|uniref:collagen binding domain-containing protein n=1 Tax=Bacillus pumilus TaxID=1408 RepID=UPI0011A313F1
TCNIPLNYNFKHLQHPKIHHFIQPNHPFLKNSIILYSLHLQPPQNPPQQKQLLPKQHYHIKFLQNQNPQSPFQLIFKHPIHSPYKITYQTTLEGMDLVHKTYQNKPTLYDGNTK